MPSGAEDAEPEHRWAAIIREPNLPDFCNIEISCNRRLTVRRIRSECDAL